MWHPYAAMPPAVAPLVVESATGVRLQLDDGRELIDGMASWWSAIHGYQHPALDAALLRQSRAMSHVMFGGLTHRPALDLVSRLVRLSPDGLERVFLADSGSVSVEVALKMAIQYWAGRGRPGKYRICALGGGYHGDTLGAMAVCDPINSMHSAFGPALPSQPFLPRPPDRRAGPDADRAYLAVCDDFLRERAPELAALIVEPIAQGAGGMWFYSPAVLAGLAELCRRHELLLIADEIATGFGRTGRFFACDWADVTPDIMCVGKAMTGGYLTMAAALTTADVAAGVADSSQGALMHGPTFMANPLAAAIASASLELLESGDWTQQVASVGAGLTAGLAGLAGHPAVADVRVLGAIGVVELREPAAARIQARAVERGVWLRPFGRLVYTLPPYITTPDDVAAICDAIAYAVSGD